MNRTGQVRPWHDGPQDQGASLVFALVAVSIASLAVAGLTSATSSGFLAQRSLDATDLGAAANQTAATRIALDTAIEAMRAGADTSYRSFWSADTRSAAQARCFGATASTTGADFVDVSTAGAVVRVFCSTLERPAVAAPGNPFVQAAAQPALSDGLVLLHRSTAAALTVNGTGTLGVAGRVRANGALAFVGRSGSCPQASSATAFDSTSSCPQLQVRDIVAGDGTGSLSATACDATGIDASGSIACSASQSATAPAAPRAAPTTFGTATVANGPLDIRCSAERATLSPGLYSETATAGITAVLNSLTGATPATCVIQSTTVRTTTNAGATSLPVNERKGFRAGDVLAVGGTGGETLTVKSTYTATTGAGSLTLASATTKKWTSGSTVTGAACVRSASSPCNGSGGTTISRLTLTPGTYFFDLNANWTVDNPSVTVVGGTPNPSGSTSLGDLCIAPTDQSAANGVVIAFDGGSTSGSNNASGYGLVINRGTVALCASPPATTTDRPLALYGPTSTLTGSYRKVGATSNTSYSFVARGTSCSTGTKTNCSIASVASGGHLFLYGGIHAPYDDVTLAAGAYDDDQLLLYGVVADALTVATTQVPDDARGARPLAGLPRVASDLLDIDFTAYRCDASGCPGTPPSGRQVGEAVVSFAPATVSGVDTRTATLVGPLAAYPFWLVTG